MRQQKINPGSNLMINFSIKTSANIHTISEIKLKCKFKITKINHYLKKLS